MEGIVERLRLVEAIVEQGGQRMILAVVGDLCVETFSNTSSQDAQPDQTTWREARSFEKGYNFAFQSLQADNAALREGLAFYAAPESYCMIYGFADGDPRGFAPVLQDDGKIARVLIGKEQS